MLQKCACGIAAIKLSERGKVRVVASEIIIAPFGTILKCSCQVFLEVSACLLKLRRGIKSRSRMRFTHPAGLHGGQREMDFKAELLAGQQVCVTGQQTCYRAAVLRRLTAQTAAPEASSAARETEVEDSGTGAFGTSTVKPLKPVISVAAGSVPP